MKIPTVSWLLLAFISLGNLTYPAPSIPAPDIWWASLEGDARKEFIHDYIVVHDYFAGELKYTTERAIAKIDELTGIEKEKNIRALRQIVEWAQAQKRLADVAELSSSSPRVWLANLKSSDAILAKWKEQEEVIRPDIDRASKQEQDVRTELLK